MKNKHLKKRILDISYKKGLSHLGSCLTAVDIIDEIYRQKLNEERFVLSSGHAGLAWYCVIEANGGKSAEEIFNHHGVHPDRCSDCGLSCSAGSLGQGLPIALGMALADRSKNVYCLISDGEMAEGSVWEALRIQREQALNNLKIYCNWNGFAAYKKTKELPTVISNYGVNILITNMLEWPEWLQGQEAHYKVMNEDEYKGALELCK